MIALLGSIGAGFCMLFLLLLVRSIPVVRSISFLINLGHGVVVGIVFAMLIAKQRPGVTWKLLILGGAVAGAVSAAVEIPVRLLLGYDILFAPALSFMFAGLGAAVYAMLEHGPAAREDNQREDAFRKAIQEHEAPERTQDEEL